MALEGILCICKNQALSHRIDNSPQWSKRHFSLFTNNWPHDLIIFFKYSSEHPKLKVVRCFVKRWGEQ